MQSLWNDEEAQSCKSDLDLRVYTSRLLGQNPHLVLHGGGNTSVKSTVPDFFGDSQEILFVKGSGWDLATIEAPGFAPVKLDVLKRLAQFDELTDVEMVREQRAAMLDPYAPNPSVEAILHAIIPYKYVDHTHADAVVTLTNTPNGLQIMKEIYGDQVLLIPYVMPGFVLAKQIRDLTQSVNWNQYRGMILLNHGVFTFSDDPKTSYETMIDLVTQAEEYLESQKANLALRTAAPQEDLAALSHIRKVVSEARGQAVIAQILQDPKSVGFSTMPDVQSITTRGPITPEHVIRIKHQPVIFQGDPESEIQNYMTAYKKYFERHDENNLTMLDPVPRWGIWPGYGVVCFDKNYKNTQIAVDIVEHVVDAVQYGEALGGWRPLEEPSWFEVEYWELEQVKLKKGGAAPPLTGKIALITGAASGIGWACAQKLHQQGAVVVGLDIKLQVTEKMNRPDFHGIVGDVTEPQVLRHCVQEVIRLYGGLDIVVANAGVFPQSMRIEEIETEAWQRSMALNLNHPQQLLQYCIPYLKNGIDPTVIFIASKNAPAPGPGQAAYSVAKAGVTQLARIAALELAEHNIRVNTIHPDAVFDTGLWSDDVLTARAQHYGMTVDQYKRRNLLKTEIEANDVAELVASMVGPAFGKTTGAQVPIDGGNERVI